MNNQMQNNQTTAEKRGGKFCPRCGQPLDATAICHNPGCPTNLNANQYVPQQRPVNPQYSAVPQQQSYNQQYQQQSYIQNSVPQQPSAPTIFTLAWDYVKVFFSSKPLAAVENIGKTAENIWLVLGSAATILISLGLFGIGTRKFFLVFLSVLLELFAAAGINSVIFYLYKQKINYLRSLNILSASLLPLMLGGAVAFVLSFISIIFARIMILSGMILSFIMLYYGMQKACNFSKSPFWGFAAVIVADLTSLYVVLTMLGNLL